MAFVFGDRVYETSTTTGNGTLTLAGIGAANYRTFSDVIGNTNTCYYSIVHRNANEWEVGVGTVSAGALARTTVLKTSAGNTTKIVFSAGTKDVFCDLPAERLVTIDAAGTALTDLTGVAITAGAASFTTIAGSDATEATSTITGALKTAGGLGVVKALWVGGLANIAGNLTVGASKFVVTAATGAIVSASSLQIAGALTGVTTGAFSGIQSYSEHIKFVVNDKFLYGTSTGAALKALIGLTSGDKVLIDGDAVGSSFGGACDVTGALSVGTKAFAFGANDSGGAGYRTVTIANA